MSVFITFEGGEGSGKSFQTRSIYRKLLLLAIPVVLVHEPGCTPLGDKLGRLLKWGRTAEISPVAELMLFNAARAQLVEQVIKPELENGKIVICDRFADSTVAYQGYGRGLNIEEVTTLNRTASSGLKPDLTFLLDIPVQDGLARKSAREFNRFEREEIFFHNRVRHGYLKLATESPGRFVVIDALQSKQQIAQIIWNKVSRMIGRDVSI